MVRLDIDLAFSEHEEGRDADVPPFEGTITAAGTEVRIVVSDPLATARQRPSHAGRDVHGRRRAGISGHLRHARGAGRADPAARRRQERCAAAGHHRVEAHPARFGVGGRPAARAAQRRPDADDPRAARDAVATRADDQPHRAPPCHDDALHARIRPAAADLRGGRLLVGRIASARVRPAADQDGHRVGRRGRPAAAGLAPCTPRSGTRATTSTCCTASTRSVGGGARDQGPGRDGGGASCAPARASSWATGGWRTSEPSSPITAAPTADGRAASSRVSASSRRAVVRGR